MTVGAERHGISLCTAKGGGLIGAVEVFRYHAP